jgi:hypothetical protein
MLIIWGNTFHRFSTKLYNNMYLPCRNGQTIGLTVFHDAAIPPDEFVANCNLSFDEIKDQKARDMLVSLY